jgi:MarR family transcriptional regulator, lower aerobic nicotinate degradation pathway regulator
MNRIVELVNTFAKYEEQNPNLSIKDFCVQYLVENSEKPKETGLWQMPLNGELGGLVGRLGAYAGMYSKKALSNLNLNNVEDWVYLIVLNEMGTPKKSELIYQMLSEFPSGIDVIKRLINNGFAEEFPDENDKRSKRVKITQSGLEVVQKGYPEMQKVGEMAFGTLSEVEKQILVNILRKLEIFHDGHYKNIRTAEFEEAFTLLTTH